jgi:hypothetical protein
MGSACADFASVTNCRRDVRELLPLCMDDAAARAGDDWSVAMLSGAPQYTEFAFQPFLPS